MSCREFLESFSSLEVGEAQERGKYCLKLLIYHDRQWSVIITLLEARDIIQINNRADSHIWNMNTVREKKHWQVFYCFVCFNQFQHWQVLQPVQFEKRRGICCLQFIFDHSSVIVHTSLRVSSQLHQMVIHFEIDKIYLQRMKNWHLHNLEVLICPIVRRLSCPARQSKMHLPPLSQLSWNSNTTHFPSKVKIWFTRPKQAYGRQRLDWIVGPEYSFGVI